VRNVFFQVHLWVGALVGAYIFVMSVSGSLIVYRNELSGSVSVEWLVNLHENWLAGSTGHWVNGVGAICLSLLCLTGAVIWWPGTKYWRRSLRVDWSAHFPRINWDLHSALGFGCLASSCCGALRHLFFISSVQCVALLDPTDRFTDTGLFWLSQLHFGRFAGLPRLCDAR
jgi:uncharacterized iron-regulated membrane protein